MGRRCFAKKAILFLYWRWYNSCKGSYYTCFMTGRSAGAACSRPIGQLYHFASLHGIIAAKRLLYVQWPFSSPLVRQPEKMADYTILLRCMV